MSADEHILQSRMRPVAAWQLLALIVAGTLAPARASGSGESAQAEREAVEYCREIVVALRREVSAAPVIPLSAEPRLAFNEVGGEPPPGGACDYGDEATSALRGEPVKAEDVAVKVGELSLAGESRGVTHRVGATVRDAGGPGGSGRYWLVDIAVDFGGATAGACFICYTYAFRPLMRVENPPRWQLFRDQELVVYGRFEVSPGGELPLALVYRLDRPESPQAGAARFVIDPERTARAIGEVGEAFARGGDRLQAEAYRAYAVGRQCREAERSWGAKPRTVPGSK